MQQQKKNDLCNIQGELFYTRHYIHMYKTYIHCIHMYKTYTGRNKGQFYENLGFVAERKFLQKHSTAVKCGNYKTDDKIIFSRKAGALIIAHNHKSKYQIERKFTNNLIYSARLRYYKCTTSSILYLVVLMVFQLIDQLLILNP